MTKQQVERTFIITAESYYFHGHPGTVVDELTIQVRPVDPYLPTDSPTGSFDLQWEDLGSRPPAPLLRAFSDAWAAIWTHCQDLGAALATLAQEDEHPSRQDVVAILLELGYKDVTMREDPATRGQPRLRCRCCGQELVAPGSTRS